jgi:hypothetical protein
LATFFSEKVIPIVQKVSEAFGSNPDGMGGTLTTLADGIQTFVQPIFEGFKSAFDSIKDTIVENKDEFERFFNVVKAAAPIIGNVIGAALTVIGEVASVVLNVMANVIGALQDLVNKAIQLINLAIRGFNLLKPGGDIAPIGDIGTDGDDDTKTGALGNLQLSTGTILKNSRLKKLNTTTTATTTAGGLTTGGTGGTTIGGTIKKIAKDNKKVIDDVAGAFDDFTSGTTTLAGIMAASNKPFAFGTSGANTSTLAGIMAASNAPTINLTVNGAMDAEGTARTIVDTLNNSFYRGTGGAGSLQIA